MVMLAFSRNCMYEERLFSDMKFGMHKYGYVD